MDNKAYNLPKGIIISVKFVKNHSAIWEHVFGENVLFMFFFIYFLFYAIATKGIKVP